MAVRVKICGITNVDDALAAIDAGADALGFMFYEPSPRFVMPAQAQTICRQLPPFVAKVGVFVDAPEEFVRAIATDCGLDALQFHGKETAAFCGRFPWKTIKAFRMRDAESLAALREYAAQTWLLDAFVPGQKGGTGERFNWDLAVAASQFGGRIILAGGLSALNVFEACRKVRPFAVDVSSGVESAPGKKDAKKMRNFIQEARRSAELEPKEFENSK